MTALSSTRKQVIISDPRRTLGCCIDTSDVARTSLGAMGNVGNAGGIQQSPAASAAIARTITGIDFAAGVPLFIS